MPAAMPGISVVMCLHNSARHIEETIASVLAQSWTDFELVILDDGSSDDSADLIERRFSDPRITLVRAPHRGLGIARATVVSLARAPYIAFLDHDDVWHRSKLQRQMEVAAARPGAGLMFCDSLLIDSASRRIGVMSERYDYGCINLDAGFAHGELLARGCFIPLSTVLVRGDVLARAGGVDGSFAYAGDYDMWLRMSRLSDVAYLPEPLSSWRIHGAQFTQRHMDVAVLELRRIWTPVLHDASYPATVRDLVGEHLLGQHRLLLEFLLKERRLRDAIHVVRTALGQPWTRRYLAARLRALRPRHAVKAAAWCARLLARSGGTSTAAFVRSIGDDRIRLRPLPSSTTEC